MLLMMFTSLWANKLCGVKNFSKQFLKLEDTNLINKMEKETMEARKTICFPQ